MQSGSRKHEIVCAVAAFAHTVYAENTIDKFTKRADDTRNAFAGRDLDRLKTQYGHQGFYKSIKDTWWLPTW